MTLSSKGGWEDQIPVTNPSKLKCSHWNQSPQFKPNPESWANGSSSGDRTTVAQAKTWAISDTFSNLINHEVLLIWPTISFGIHLLLLLPDTCWASLVAQTEKNLPVMWETWVRSLGWEDPLEKEVATHFSILAWRIPWAEELGGATKRHRQLSD